jgi:hypothetical protein
VKKTVREDIKQQIADHLKLVIIFSNLRMLTALNQGTDRKTSKSRDTETGV